jgi:TRAP-type transport system periplasmic protein
VEAHMNGFAKVLLSNLLIGSLAMTATKGVSATDIQARTLRNSIGVNAEHPIGKGTKRFSEVVAAKSGGKLDVKPYYSGTLGDDAKAIAALQGGVQEMTSTSTSPLVGNIREFGVFDLPFLFANEREADAVLDGPLGKKLLDKLPARGLIGLCYWENGFRHATNSKRPITKAEDFGGLKFRTMQSPIYLDTFNALGSNALPMAFAEVYTGLEARAIDGQENPIATIDSAKLNEVQKYLSLTKHSYSPLPVLVSKKFWDRLSLDEQKILQDSCVEVRDYQRKLNRESDTQILQQLREKGMQINELTPQELTRIREKIKPVIEKHVKTIGEDLVGEMYAEIAKVRQQ